MSPSLPLSGTHSFLAASTLGAALSARPAFADTVDDAVNVLTGAVQVGGDAVKSALPVVQDAIKTAQPLVERAVPIVQDGLKVGGKVLSDAAASATPIATKAAGEAGKYAFDSLKSAGVPVDSPAVKSAVDTTGSVFDFLVKQDPQILAEGSIVALALFFLGGPLFGSVFDLLKGYKGDLTAPQGLDLLLSDGSALLVDLRVST